MTQIRQLQCSTGIWRLSEYKAEFLTCSSLNVLLFLAIALFQTYLIILGMLFSSHELDIPDFGKKSIKERKF